MKKTFLSTAAALIMPMMAAEAAPKNVILLIGDGMGEAEISATRNYEFDSGAGLFLDTMENTASAIVISKRNDNADNIAFVGDSASGGTALATGMLTSVRRISTTAQHGKPMKTIAEEAKENGFKVGLVTTAVITDATPAAFGSHVNNRYCMYAGQEACTDGEAPIINQYLDLGVDVMMGGGYRLLPAQKDGTTVENDAKSKGYTIVKSADDLDGVTADKVWGVFSDYHLPRTWKSVDGKPAEKVSVGADGNVIFPDAERCIVNPDHTVAPSLEQMTEKALSSLSSNNDKGFFLMVEGASIDKAAHDADICGSMGSMLEFDRTAKLAVDYAKNHPDTVVIITADHGGSTQNIHHPYYENYIRTAENLPGLYEMLLSKGGNEMVIYYGTDNADDQAHTGINVPVYSYGLPQDMTFKGTIRQTDIKGVMAKFLFD
ncbi:alkaline phosphatase [Pseudemcibacter aquimaris]|uniref:alkaline phosphatase n=1 Tax=Pseudemcibacter aquimaris TaxID=2857064 RepID=UPI002012E68C|nr:alkaline phosphatase [Pseudemcibacter aquimaris]MCC3860103.1 alkaline phosphatase [Pseudemcibacter aquimaris]WDU57432.1 alkaline phosphatase [Pseudemcibacter aquimaris]